MARVLSRELVPTAPWNRHWPLLLPWVGRRLRWRLARGPVSFTLQSLSVVPGWAGRLRSIRATVAEVEINAVRLDTVDVHARDVRLRYDAVTAGRVRLDVRLGQAGLDDLLETGMPYARISLTGDVGLAELRSRPRWGRVELEPDVDEGALLLRPRAVRFPSGRRWTRPAQMLPRLRIGAHVLLPGSRLLAARVEGDALRLTAEVDDLSVPLAGAPEPVPDLGRAAPEARPSVEW